MAPRNPLPTFSEKKVNNAFWFYLLLVIRNVCTSCVLRYLVIASVNLMSNSLSPMFSKREVNVTCCGLYVIPFSDLPLKKREKKRKIFFFQCNLLQIIVSFVSLQFTVHRLWNLVSVWGVMFGLSACDKMELIFHLWLLTLHIEVCGYLLVQWNPSVWDHPKNPITVALKDGRSLVRYLHGDMMGKIFG